jgi:CPA2 family monovalent cation:H+ antiporter-2
VAVAVSAITTLATPWLIRASGPAASFIDRKLPRPLQTFVALYGSWWDRLRHAPRRDTLGANVRRLVALLLGDGALVGAVAIGTALGQDALLGGLARHFGIAATTGRIVIALAAVALAAPFLVGMIRVARRLGALLAELALPRDEGADRAAAPRRALVVTLQLACLLLAGTPLVAIVQPFLPGFPVGLALLPILLVMGWAFWRSATNLHGHVRSGALVVAEMLAAQSGTEARGHELDGARDMLPGIGEPVPVHLDGASEAVGKTLAELDLRGVTGATVLTITRAEGSVCIPTAREVLRPGDVLALAGTEDAVEAARSLLARPRA